MAGAVLRGRIRAFRPVLDHLSALKSTRLQAFMRIAEHFADCNSARVLPRFYGHFREGRYWPQEVLMSKRRKFITQFKQGAVEQVQQPGVICAQVARDLGIGANLLTLWRREAEAQAPAFIGTGAARDEELAKLKRELARVKKERDFSREAATFFARESS